MIIGDKGIGDDTLGQSPVLMSWLCLLGKHLRGKDDYKPKSKEADNGTS